MKSVFITLSLLLIAQLGYAQIPAPPALPPYPSSSLAGEPLRVWLRQNWYDNKHTSLGYNTARDKMYGWIDNYTNTVRCVYGGHVSSLTQGATTDPPLMNTEHTIPQSFFAEESVKRSDIHHLFPTVMEWNSKRDNDPLTEIPDALTTQWMKGNNVPANLILCPSGNCAPTTQIEEYSEFAAGPDRFEPREDHKGNAARAILYFFTMYPSITGTNGTVHSITSVAALNTLLQWHAQDPVDSIETTRNRRIAGFQGNYNPFVRYPQMVTQAWGMAAAQDTSVRFSLASEIIAEGNAGNTTKNIVFSVNPLPKQAKQVRVSLNLTGTSAAASDYIFAQNNQVFTLSATNPTQTVSVQVVGNTTVGPNRTFSIKLEAVSPDLVLGSPSVYTLNIIDDDGTPAPVGAPCSELFFSEYAESSVGNTKYVEIYNPRATAVDLSGYSVAMYPNGSATTTNIANLTGSLAPRSVFVIANAGSVAPVLAEADLQSNVTFFNGNDAIALFKGTDTLDVIGVIGQDPGATIGWALSGSGSTLNNTLVRADTVSRGSKNWNLGRFGWSALGVDVFTNVGVYNSTRCITSNRNKISDAYKIRLWPNPAQHSLQLLLPAGLASEKNLDIELIGTAGARHKLDYSRKSDAVIEINIADLPKGIYGVHVQNSNFGQLLRFVK